MRVIINALVSSHLMPMVPLTWALRAAGHEVLVAGQADVIATAHAAGLATAAIGPPGSGVAQWSRPGLVTRPQLAIAQDGQEPPWEEIGARWERRVATYLDDYLDLARRWPPDLVLTDPLEFGGQVVAGVLGIPVAVHRWGPDSFTSTVQGHAARALRDLAVRAGAAYGMAAPALTLDPCPPSVQSPKLAPGQAVRFVPYNGTAELPGWLHGGRPGGRRAAICLGVWGTQTLVQEGRLPAVVRNIIEAVAAVPGLTAVFAVPAAHHDLLGPLPGGVTVAGELPVGLLLASCDLVIHHGGTGTAMTALAHGRPQLVVAQPSPVNLACAELMAACGAAVTVADPGDQADPAVLAKALERTLADDGLARAAGRVAEEIAAQPSLAQAAGQLADLAA
jgi:UDP:flavonoid glycosyltransferase YjiC (YdhE family)